MTVTDALSYWLLPGALCTCTYVMEVSYIESFHITQVFVEHLCTYYCTPIQVRGNEDRTTKGETFRASEEFPPSKSFGSIPKLPYNPLTLYTPHTQLHIHTLQITPPPNFKFTLCSQCTLLQTGAYIRVVQLPMRCLEKQPTQHKRKTKQFHKIHMNQSFFKEILPALVGIRTHNTLLSRKHSCTN